jgi:FKBP-type peptidyl-prolyl cis-trans isomerase
MSGVSISRSYAILVGIEGYMKVKLKKKNVEEKISEEKTKILQKAEAHSRDDDDDEDVPEVSRSRPVRKKETTSSDAPPDAESKREVTENKGEEKGGGFFSGLVKTITNRGSKADETESKTVKIQGRGIPGTAPEEGVPAPEGKR